MLLGCGFSFSVNYFFSLHIFLLFPRLDQNWKKSISYIIFPWRCKTLFDTLFFITKTFKVFVLVIYYFCSPEKALTDHKAKFTTTQNITLKLLKLKKKRIRETKHLLIDAESSTDTKKILLIRQNLSKIIFNFCAEIFHPLWAEVFKYETTSFH